MFHRWISSDVLRRDNPYQIPLLLELSSDIHKDNQPLIRYHSTRTIPVSFAFYFTLTPPRVIPQFQRTTPPPVVKILKNLRRLPSIPPQTPSVVPRIAPRRYTGFFYAYRRSSRSKSHSRESSTQKGSS